MGYVYPNVFEKKKNEQNIKCLQIIAGVHLSGRTVAYATVVLAARVSFLTTLAFVRMLFYILQYVIVKNSCKIFARASGARIFIHICEL